MEFNKKAQERDNARVYRSIEDNAHIEEVQSKLEDDLQKEEMDRIRREKDACEIAKLKAEQTQKANKEKEKKRQDEMNKERKEMYDRVIQEAIEKRERMEAQVH